MFLLTTTAEKEAALSLFCELGISSQDQFCLEMEVNLRRKEGKQIFSKNCTCQQVNMARNTLTSIVAAVNSICKKRQKNCLIHGELTEANKALCFFSERGVI